MDMCARGFRWLQFCRLTFPHTGETSSNWSGQG
jgi:hypothetical protein